MWLFLLSEVFFDGTTEADGDDEAAVGLFGGRAEVFCGEEFFGGFGYQACHFWWWWSSVGGGNKVAFWRVRIGRAHV